MRSRRCHRDANGIRGTGTWNIDEAKLTPAGEPRYEALFVLELLPVIRWQQRCRGKRMAKKATKLRPWTKEDVRTLKTLAREKVKTSVIARKLKRTLEATYQKAKGLRVSLGGGRRKKGA